MKDRIERNIFVVTAVEGNIFLRAGKENRWH